MRHEQRLRRVARLAEQVQEQEEAAQVIIYQGDPPTPDDTWKRVVVLMPDNRRDPTITRGAMK